MLGVVGDLGDDLGGFFARVGLVGFGQVEAGDLEAVEEQTGAARVDVVGGNSLENDGKTLLDGGTVLGVG